MVRAVRTSNLLFVLALAALGPGCKKPQPSPEFGEAQALHAKLFAQKLDQAYLDPQMDRVLELLKAVPPDSSDAQAARELEQKVVTERERVRAAEERRRKAMAEALKPTPSPFPAAPMAATPPPAQARPDAGPSQPAAGMKLAEFLEHFSGCFNPGKTIEVKGKPHASFELRDLPSCRDGYPAFRDQVVLADEVMLIGWVPKSDVRVEFRILDGGAADSGR